MWRKYDILKSKNIKNAAVGGLIIRFSSAFFAFINGILLARLLSVQGLGYYVLIFSSITVLAIPVTMGIPQLLIRFTSKYQVHNQLSHLKGLIIKTHYFVLYTTLIVYALAALAYLFWWNDFEDEIKISIVLGLLLLPTMGFGALRSGSLKGMKLVILSELPDTLIRNLLFTLLLMLNLILGYKLTLQWAMIYQLLASTIGLAIGFLFFKKHLLLKLRNIKPTFDTKNWIKQTIPFSINNGVQVTRGKLLTYILAIFGSIEAVAIFEVASRGAALVSFTLNGLNSAISPFISSAFERGNKVYLQRILKISGRIIFITSLPVALIFIIGGTPLITLIFGGEYNKAYIPLIILCIGQLVSTLVGSVGLLLNMTGYQKIFSNSNLVTLILNLILSIPFVLYLDVIGASILYSVLLIVQNLYLLFYVRKHLKINTAII